MPTNNPGIQTATSTPGMKSPLGNEFGMSPNDVTVTGGLGSGTSFPGQGIDLSQFSPSLSSINFDSSSLDTPSFDFGTGSGSGSSLLSSAISTLTGGSGFGNLAAIGGEAAAAAYGLSQAKAAQQKAEQQAQQIMGPANKYLDSSQQLLQQYFSQTLNPGDQKFVDFATTEGQNIINSGQGMKAIADQQLGQFAKGQLLAADQLELDQNTAAAKQQIAQNMAKSGTSDSSIAAGYNQQIDQAAQIQKQKVLNGYFQTGNQAYNSWLTSTTQGAQLMQQGATFSHQAFQDMLSSSLSLGQVGMSGLTTAIGLEIQSDNELGKSVSDLMANLASAFAYTVAGGSGGSGGAGGGSGGGGILSSLLNLGKAGSSLYSSASSGFAAAGAGAVADNSGVFGQIASGAAAQEASDFASITAGGFSAAGGGAAGSAAGGATAFGTEAGIAPASAMTSIMPANAGIAGSISNLSSVGTGAVNDAVVSAGSNAAAALGGGSVGGAAAAPAGLASSGSFATGGGAASAGAGGGSAASIGAVAGPIAVAATAFAASQALGAAWTGKETQGNSAMKGWMKATGATFKANYTNSGQNTFGTNNNLLSASSNPGTMYDKSGNVVTPQKAAQAIHDWAVANGVNPGDFK